MLITLYLIMIALIYFANAKLTDKEQTRSNVLKVSELGTFSKCVIKCNIHCFIRMIGKRGKLEKWPDENKAPVVSYICTDLAIERKKRVKMLNRYVMFTLVNTQLT